VLLCSSAEFALGAALCWRPACVGYAAPAMRAQPLEGAVPEPEPRRSVRAIIAKEPSIADSRVYRHR
jgi:hypothetical protein